MFDKHIYQLKWLKWICQNIFQQIVIILQMPWNVGDPLAFSCEQLSCKKCWGGEKSQTPEKMTECERWRWANANAAQKHQKYPVVEEQLWGKPQNKISRSEHRLDMTSVRCLLSWNGAEINWGMVTLSTWLGIWWKTTKVCKQLKDLPVEFHLQSWINCSEKFGLQQEAEIWMHLVGDWFRWESTFRRRKKLYEKVHTEKVQVKK